MLTSEVVQLFGSVGLTVFGVLLISISREARRYGRYGREALAVSGVLVLSIVGARMAALTDVVSQTTARQVNGMSAWVALVVLAQVVYLHRRERRALDQWNP